MRNLIILLWQAFLMFVVMPLFLMVLNVLFGAISGWLIGLFFGNTIIGVLDCVGISGFSMWEIGAFMGFIAGFFRKMITFNSNKVLKSK